jgi:hypothetical protein
MGCSGPCAIWRPGSATPMPHGKKAASKTPMDAYVDGCRVTWISTECPKRKSRRSSSPQTSRRANASASRDAIPGLARRAWQGRSNPLLLTPLHLAPDSRRRANVGHFDYLTASSDGAIIAKYSLEARIRRFKTCNSSPRGFGAKLTSKDGSEDGAQFRFG